MRVCIYCLERKSESAFNREHVIPEAFGAFEGNLVIECVCKDCNRYFGETIDLKLARDSFEGIDRFLSGMKSPAEYKSLGRRSTTKVRFKEGAVQGATGYHAPNPAGGELRVFAFPQIGFEQPPDGVKWFEVGEVPEKSALATHGIDLAREVTIHTRELSEDDATTLLHAKGFAKLGAFTTTIPPEETIETKTVGVIARPEKRAATKIAMNYLARATSPAILRSASFDDVRNFVRHDLGESRVHVSMNPWGFRRNGTQTAKGHYLALQTMPSGRIVAQVSLMLRLRYVVHLMSTHFVVATPTVLLAHFFDLNTRAVTRIPVPPLIPGQQLTVVGPDPVPTS